MSVCTLGTAVLRLFRLTTTYNMGQLCLGVTRNAAEDMNAWQCLCLKTMHGMTIIMERIDVNINYIA